jgi:hypothetical protein
VDSASKTDPADAPTDCVIDTPNRKVGYGDSGSQRRLALWDQEINRGAASISSVELVVISPLSNLSYPWPSKKAVRIAFAVIDALQ